MTFRRNADGSLYRTDAGNYIIDHEHGPTELSASEVILAARLIKDMFRTPAVLGWDWELGER